MPADGPPRALPLGKLPPELLAELVRPRHELPPEVLLGPRVGEDACAIRIGSGVLVAATDPITLTGDEVGAHAVWINANDVAVSGVRPRWFLATVLLPAGTEEASAVGLFQKMHRALDALGVALVGGHTEVTDAVRQPVVVGQMLGHAADGRFVPTGGLSPGDSVLQIGPAPIEGAAILAARPGLVGVSERDLEAARAALASPGISVVESALACARLGASALHDPTEGGLATGLHELAETSGVRIDADPEQVQWFEPGRALCRALGLDPWGTLASGCLLAGMPGPKVAAARRELASLGHTSTRLGLARHGAGVRLRGAGPLPRFARDELSRLGDASR